MKTPTVRKQPVNRGGVKGILIVEKSTGPRPLDRYLWDTFSAEDSVWYLQRFIPDGEAMPEGYE